VIVSFVVAFVWHCFEYQWLWSLLVWCMDLVIFVIGGGIVVLSFVAVDNGAIDCQNFRIALL